MAGWIMYGILYITIHTLIKIGWWRWRVEGLEYLPPRDMGGMIVVMNHTNWMDIPVIGALLPFSYRLSWLGKDDLFKHPVAGWWFRAMNVIPIRRGARDIAALDASAAALRDGAVLLIFPEGHRSRDGQLQKGRGGAIRLAMRSGVPIVPLALTGTQYGLRGTLCGKEVCLKIGPAFTIEPTDNFRIPADMMECLTTYMMLQVAELLPVAYRGYYQRGSSHDISLGPRSALQPTPNSCSTRHHV